MVSGKIVKNAQKVVKIEKGIVKMEFPYIFSFNIDLSEKFWFTMGAELKFYAQKWLKTLTLSK